MMLVVDVPKSGLPDDSSKTEPTAAIAATQEPSRKIPLLGVMYMGGELDNRKRLGDRFNSLYRESILDQFLIQSKSIIDAIDKHYPVQVVNFVLNYASH